MKQLIIYLIFILYGVSAFCQNDQDKIEIDNWVIEFNNCDSTNFNDFFENQDKIDSISNYYDNRHRESLAIEKYQLNKYQPPIQIDGKKRIVELQNKKIIHLIPNDTLEEVEYTFEKEIGDYYLFRVQWFEGNNYFLLNTKTGQKTYTIGRVYISKSGKYLISINDDIEAGYSDNGFQLFKISKTGEINKLWKFSPSWAPEQIKWINDETLMVKCYYLSENDNWGKKTIFKEMKIKNKR